MCFPNVILQTSLSTDMCENSFDLMRRRQIIEAMLFITDPGEVQRVT